ncbi:hypothetical protein M8J75_007226 [Diaphorina citri]|nr:hypothetical protein M8J75_007226 [Diaphorina citri]
MLHSFICKKKNLPRIDQEDTEFYSTDAEDNTGSSKSTSDQDSPTSAEGPSVDQSKGKFVLSQPIPITVKDLKRKNSVGDPCPSIVAPEGHPYRRPRSPNEEQRSRSYDQQHQRPKGASKCCEGNCRHRHSISGQMCYLKNSTGYGFRRGLALSSSSGNSLFSTAVISGSSSAPNLRNMIPSTTNVTALDGFGGVPSIRPLETLHNALSLKHLDNFLGKMIRVIPSKTPASSPPKYPSTPIEHSLSGARLGWSGPPSFVSESGPSSPNALSDYFFKSGLNTSDSCSSEFSSSRSSVPSSEVDIRDPGGDVTPMSDMDHDVTVVENEDTEMSTPGTGDDDDITLSTK